MRNLLAGAVLIVVQPTTGLSQELTTTVETTVTISEEEMTTATFSQLVKAIRSFDGKVLSVEGEMYSNHILEDEFTVVIDDGLHFEIGLDDGRQVTKTARQCASVHSRRSSAGCQVALDIELDLGPSGYEEFIHFGGVGFNVEFR